MNKRQWIGTGCLTVGICMLMSSFGAWFAQAQIEREAGIHTDALLPLVEMHMSTLSHTAAASAPQQFSVEETMPTVQFEGKDCIGVLSFPSMELVLPVLADCTDALLETAPCRQYGSAAGKDLVIAGHNYRRHFKRLREISYGDSVLFTDVYGREYQYRVADFETLLPTELDRMLAGDWDLSLYTCTSGGKKRLTVRCSLVGE